MGTVKTILITGANGFVGSHVLKLLNAYNFEPILLLRTNSNTWRIDELIHSLRPSIYYTDAETFDIAEIFETHQIDAIIHLATEYGRNAILSDIIETNVVFPLRLLDVAKSKIQVFINTDTFFGKRQYNQSYLKEYTASKRILQKLLGEYSSGVKIVNLRLEHVFGELDAEGKFFTSILRSLLTQKPEIELTDGTQKRDFIYVQDVAEAYISVLQNVNVLGSYQEFEVGTGQCISIKYFVSKLALLTSSSSSLHFGALPTRDGEIAESIADNESLAKIGWKIRHTLDQAIQLIITKEKIRFNL
ncbi:MAG: NAD-dependent epimerase/dehydratase [Pedobacter sp.]